MMSSENGRRAYERCWRDQDSWDALPIERSACAIYIQRREPEETTGEDEFVGRVIVRYREEHELETSMLEVAIRSRTGGEAASVLAAGRTPPPKRIAEPASDVEEIAAIEELASVFGERSEHVEDRLRGCHERGEPFLPVRFRELLGRERMYEVRSKSPSTALTAIRCFLLRVASANMWTHWGVIDGPVRVELPFRYDVTFIDTPGIDSSTFTLERVLRPAIGDSANERFGMFLFVCGAGAPQTSTWNALERIGTLKKIVTDESRVCLCWPVEQVIKSNRPDGFLSNLQIKKFADDAIKVLKSHPNHWKRRFHHFLVTSNLGIGGDLKHGVSIAFVRTTSAEPPARNAINPQYCLYRLSYAIEQQVRPPPPSDEISDNFPDAVVCPVVDETKRPNKPCEKQVEKHIAAKDTKLQRDESKREIGQKPSSPPKTTKQSKARPRECTIADPFAFTEDDAVLFPPQEEVGTTPVFGKKSRTVLKNTANSPARTRGTIVRVSKQSKTVPKPALPLATAEVPKQSPRLSATPISKPPIETPIKPPSPNTRRPLRDHAHVKSPWWETKHFSWEVSSNIR